MLSLPQPPPCIAGMNRGFSPVDLQNPYSLKTMVFRLVKGLDPLITGVLIILFTSFIPTAILAQSGITLSWDSEVGCLDYDYDKDREQPIELIGEEDCLLACHESTITFTVDYGTLPVTDIDWTAEGGYVVSLSNGDAVAEISWPTVQSGGGGPPVEMSVVPNPAQHIAQVEYSVHDLPD